MSLSRRTNVLTSVAVSLRLVGFRPSSRSSRLRSLSTTTIQLATTVMSVLLEERPVTGELDVALLQLPP
jgi:hypothetical protein